MDRGIRTAPSLGLQQQILDRENVWWRGLELGSSGDFLGEQLSCYDFFSDNEWQMEQSCVLDSFSIYRFLGEALLILAIRGEVEQNGRHRQMLVVWPAVTAPLKLYQRAGEQPSALKVAIRPVS